MCTTDVQAFQPYQKFDERNSGIKTQKARFIQKKIFPENIQKKLSKSNFSVFRN